MKFFKSYGLEASYMFPLRHRVHLHFNTLKKRPGFSSFLIWAHISNYLLVDKVFSKIIRRNSYILFKKSVEVRIVLKVEIISYFSNCKIGIGKQTFGFQQYTITNQIPCCFTQQILAQCVQVVRCYI